MRVMRGFACLFAWDSGRRNAGKVKVIFFTTQIEDSGLAGECGAVQCSAWSAVQCVDG